MLYFTTETEDAAFWKAEGEKELDRALKLVRNENKANNIILFLGDGMGMTTITPARILKGQLKGMTGEEEILAMDTFPHVGISKVVYPDKGQKIR